ncbi:hypothetical protein [Compostibacter hankyongensis]|uniref:Uncharacterized protein n=1 Tax=Compostibacter hankyongensis TaxID=1007089 RepID=A0ABP8FZY9_9BACT
MKTLFTILLLTATLTLRAQVADTPQPSGAVPADNPGLNAGPPAGGLSSNTPPSTDIQQSDPSASAGLQRSGGPLPFTFNPSPALQQLPTRALTQINAKTAKLQRRLNRASEKALRRFSRTQAKLYDKLSRVDSLAANNLFTKEADKLSQLPGSLEGKLAARTGKAGALASKINQFTGGQLKNTAHSYFPYLDTLKNALGFLRGKGKGYLSQAKDVQSQLQGSLDRVQTARQQLDQAARLQTYLQQRQQQLLDQLGNLSSLGNSSRYGFLQKDLLRLNKEAYYYAARLKNYKELFSDKQKAEAEALALVQKIPAFRDFMKKHSALAGLFNLPGTGLTPTGATPDLTGLQTREMVARELQQRLATADAGGRRQISQQMQQAREKLRDLKNKFPGGGSTAEMPNFQPKELKSKTFFQRLAFGGNLQFAKSTSGYPTTSDLAGQVAYKFSKNGSAGVGASFKLGWGSSIQKIHFTAQGAGLRSFLDYKLKGTFYVNGGAELNYLKTQPDVPALKSLNGWTGSALIGLEKKYRVSSKLKGTLMLLYDFLHNQHTPVTPPVLFRMGYEF